jgi:hypothetical protein
MRKPIRPSIPLAVAGALTLAVSATEAPPLKPGLWQVTTERTVNGQAAPSGVERMQNLRPEARVRMEAAMRTRGMALPASGTGPIRICMTAEGLRRGQFQSQPDNGRCETNFKSRTASGWKWHTTCALPRLNGSVNADGEAIFASPESYRVNISSTMQAMGRTTQSTNHMSAQWLSADCGAVKPLEPRGGQAATPGR